MFDADVDIDENKASSSNEDAAAFEDDDYIGKFTSSMTMPTSKNIP